MAESKLFKKDKQDDEVPGQLHFAVSGKKQQKLCQPCSEADQKTVAENMCLECSEFLCSSCSATHTRFTFAKNHKIVQLNEEVIGLTPFDMKGLDQCKNHKEMLKFICEDDDELCCSTCAIFYHRKCQSLVEIEKEANAKVFDFSSFRQTLMDIDSSVKTYVQRLASTKETVTKDGTEITKKIQEMQDKVNEIFENLKRTVVKEIHSFQQQAFYDLDMNNDKCEKHIADIKRTLSEIDNVSQRGTTAQQLIMAHHLKDQVTTLKENTDMVITDPTDISMTFDFNPFLTLPPTNNDIPGKLTTRNNDTIVVIPNDIKSSAEKDQKVKLTLLASINLKLGDGDVEEPCYRGLDFLPDGRLVGVDSYNKKCVVYDKQLEKMGSILLPVHPLKVTVVTDEKMVVTTGNAFMLVFLKISHENEITISHTLNTTLKLNSICMMTDDSFLVGCHDDPQHCRVISVSGDERELGINFPQRKYALGESACAFVKNCNKVVVTDKNANTVYIYDVGNNSKVEVEDGMISQPCGVAVGPADYSFVCSFLTNSIVQISSKGHILSSNWVDMPYPFRVCVSKDNTTLAVSNNCKGYPKLALYKIELI